MQLVKPNEFPFRDWKNEGMRSQAFLANSRNQKQSQGFTLLELLVVIMLVGVLAAIAVPSWLAFWNAQKLNVAQSQIVEVMRQAQATAKRQRINYQASFRQHNNRVQWAVHPASSDPELMAWNTLEEGILLDSETTLFQTGNVYRVQFGHSGDVKGQQPLGRVTLSLMWGGSIKRCVVVSTVLGAIRTGESQSGRRCD